MAHFDTRDSFAFMADDQLNARTLALVLSGFDTYVEDDIREIIELMRQEKEHRKYAVLQTIFFPFEYLYLRLVMDKSTAADRFLLQTVYWAFIRKKITFNEYRMFLISPTKLVK